MSRILNETNCTNISYFKISCHNQPWIGTFVSKDHSAWVIQKWVGPYIAVRALCRENWDWFQVWLETLKADVISRIPPTDSSLEGHSLFINVWMVSSSERFSLSPFNKQISISPQLLRKLSWTKHPRLAKKCISGFKRLSNWHKKCLQIRLSVTLKLLGNRCQIEGIFMPLMHNFCLRVFNCYTGH